MGIGPTPGTGPPGCPRHRTEWLGPAIRLPIFTDGEGGFWKQSQVSSFFDDEER